MRPSNLDLVLGPLHEYRSLAILVGRNGSGKSTVLREIAITQKAQRQVVAVSNTVFDRFKGQRGLSRLTLSAGPRVVERTIKRALAKVTASDSLNLRPVGETLRYLGYEPEVGISISGVDSHEIADLNANLRRWDALFGRDAELVRSIVLQAFDRLDGEVTGVSLAGDGLSLLQSRTLLDVIRLERRLRRAKLLSRVNLHLRLRWSREWIPLSEASSGELTLLAVRVFVVTSTLTTQQPPLILIDEPENSLHPQWQKDYVHELLNTIGYRGANIVIATHSPIIVSGAQATEDPTVLNVSGGELTLVPGTQASQPVEQTLLDVFNTITPMNHFLSRELAELLSAVESGKVTAADAQSQLSAYSNMSFDERQQALLEAVGEMIAAMQEGT